MAYRELKQTVTKAEGFDQSGGRGGVTPGTTVILQEVCYDLGLGLRLVGTKMGDFFKGSKTEPKPMGFMAQNCNQEGAPPLKMTEEAYEAAKRDARNRSELAMVKEPSDPASIRAEDKLINLLFDSAIINPMTGSRAGAAKLPGDIAHFFGDR